MPHVDLRFLPKNKSESSDEDLLLQLVYYLCESLKDPREEASGLDFFVSHFGIPLHLVRRTLKLLVRKCNLPIPESRVDEWIEWHRKKECWIISDEMNKEANRLQEREGAEVGPEKKMLEVVFKGLTKEDMHNFRKEVGPYGIPAEALHLRIVEALKHHCQHWNIDTSIPPVHTGYPTSEDMLETHSKRPLEQTITMLITRCLLDEQVRERSLK